MKAYPKYKTLQITLASVPEHWSAIKPKFVLNLAKGRKPSETTVEPNGQLPYLTMDVLRDRDCLIQYPIDNTDLVEVCNGDVLVLWDGANAGEIISGKQGYLSSTMALIDVDEAKLDKQFSFYLFKSREPEFKNRANGTTIPHFDGNYFLNTPFVIPPIPEQLSINAYLDEVTGKIDALISEKTAQVEELRAYRSSLITETVTRGLNSDVPLRDSGINWLGSIPQNWEVSKLKYFIDIFSGDPIDKQEISSDGLFQVYGGGETMGRANKYNVESGAIIIGRVGARCGCVTRVIEKAWATDNSLICKTNQIPGYLFFLLNAANLNSLNESNAQPLITATKVKNLSVPIPPLSEQKEIADFLDDKTAKIDRLIEELTKQLDELAEYKQAVITEAVTGKVDVRDYKPNI